MSGGVKLHVVSWDKTSPLS